MRNMDSKIGRVGLVWVNLLVLAGVCGCVPQGGDMRAVQKPAPAPAASPVSTPRATATTTTTTTVGAPAQTGGCPSGSEPAVPELRSCCKARNWGEACDGGCWQAGVGAKLQQMCNNAQPSSNDCAQSPDKTQKKEWCSFHFNRRYCGISDAVWLQTCK